MNNNYTEQEAYLEEMMKGLDLEALGFEMEEYEEEKKWIDEDEEDMEEESYEPEKKSGKGYGNSGYCPPKRHKKPSMNISCDLNVEVGTKNKAIYVCPGKVQFFTASAITCSNDKLINIEYTGYSKKGVIFGRLGIYIIVNSGILFIPKPDLAKCYDFNYPIIDVLNFKATDRCGSCVDFPVIFTFSKCGNCQCSKC